MAEQVNKFQRDLGQTENTFKFQPELDHPKAQKNIVQDIEQKIRQISIHYNNHHKENVL